MATSSLILWLALVGPLTPPAQVPVVAGEVEVRNGVEGAWVSVAVLDDYLTKAGRLRLVVERLGVLERLAEGRAGELKICGERVSAEQKLSADLKVSLGEERTTRLELGAQLGAWWRNPLALLAAGTVIGGALGVWALR